jgi:phage terminase large subunit-like protein
MLLARLPPPQRAQLIQSLTPERQRNFAWDWRGWWARPDQLAPPGDWSKWLILAGRGYGKTKILSEWVRELVAKKVAGRIALVAPTAADARDVMVEGPSGILACCPDWDRPVYESSKRRMTWPNGAVAITYSADEPDRLRGPQHDAAACDELAAWRYPESWDMLMFGLRLGKNPRCAIATTPKPVKLLKELLAREGGDVIVTRGSTYENSTNLAPTFFKDIVSKYEGTRLGRQELLAELLTDVPNALWSRDNLDKLRVRQAPELLRIVVAIDPAMKSTEGSDETGIIVAGIGSGQARVLCLTTCPATISPTGLGAQGGLGLRALQGRPHHCGSQQRRRDGGSHACARVNKTV